MFHNLIFVYKRNFIFDKHYIRCSFKFVTTSRWMKLFKSNLLNFFIKEIARASPIANCIVVLDVGTIPSPNSLTSGINNFIFEDLYKVEFLFETIPIKRILFLFEYSIIFDSPMYYLNYLLK